MLLMSILPLLLIILVHRWLYFLSTLYFFLSKLLPPVSYILLLKCIYSKLLCCCFVVKVVCYRMKQLLQLHHVVLKELLPQVSICPHFIYNLSVSDLLIMTGPHNDKTMPLDKFSFPWPFPKTRNLLYNVKSCFTMIFVSSVSRILFFRCNFRFFILRNNDHFSIQPDDSA